MLRAVMDNEGTTEAIENGVDYKDDDEDKKSKYRLYITHEEAPDTADGEVYKSPYVDFEIPKYYAFKGVLESYAPKHDATFTLYPLKEDVDLSVDPTLASDPESYAEKAFLTYRLTQSVGTGLWMQDFSVKSSHLMQKDKSGQVYKLVISKPGHVSYIWLGLELTPKTLDDPGDAECLTFTLDPDVNDGMIALIGGDLDDNGANGLEDLELMTALMSGEILYTREQDESNAADWAISTYNPEALAYAADLDGNGKIGSSDLKVLNDKRNFRQRAACYQEVMPQLINAAGGSLSGVVLALFMEEPILPQWVQKLLEEDREVPDWAMELILDGQELPQWAVTCIEEETPIPDWAIACVEAGTEVPAWAVARFKAEKDIPLWAVELIREEKSVPAWAVELLQSERFVPAWAVELAQAGESLPEEMEALLAAGEELPEELPAEEPELPVLPELPELEVPEVPETPEAPENPELPEGSETPGEVEAPENPEAPTESETPEEPEPPEVPEGSEPSEAPEEAEKPEEPEGPEKAEGADKTGESDLSAGEDADGALTGGEEEVTQEPGASEVVDEATEPTPEGESDLI